MVGAGRPAEDGERPTEGGSTMFGLSKRSLVIIAVVVAAVIYFRAKIPATWPAAK